MANCCDFAAESHFVQYETLTKDTLGIDDPTQTSCGNKKEVKTVIYEGLNFFLKILSMKMFSNHSDFCFHITIHKILDQKSLYGRKNFISEKNKKTLLNF